MNIFFISFYHCVAAQPLVRLSYEKPVETFATNVMGTVHVLEAAVHEAGLLSLDIRKARRVLGWKPKWNFEKTVEETVRWYESVRRGEDPATATQRQIGEYSK